MTRPWTPAEQVGWDDRAAPGADWAGSRTTGLATAPGTGGWAPPHGHRSAPPTAAPPAAPQTYPRHTQPPKPADSGGRLLFVMLFWFGLATSVELWWLGLPRRFAAGPAEVWTATGRLTGMVAGFALLAQILLMSRVRWLERWIGAHDLVRWHRRLGATLTVAVLSHIAMIIVGYAALTDESLIGQTWAMLTGYEDLLEAFVAAGLLVTVAVSAIRAIRRHLPYEIWYWLHLTSYLVLLLGYGHQFRYGQELLPNGFGRWYWTGLHVFVVACLVWGRAITPSWLNLRHRLRVLDVVPEGTDMVSIYIGGRHLDRLPVRAGQFFRWRFLAPGCWWQTHPFSLSAAPNGRWLRLTVKAVGRHTSRLQRLAPGVRVLAYGPSGVFTAEHQVRGRALLIAGGSGIAPVRALLEELPPGTVVLYRANSPTDLVFRAELDRLAHERHAEVWYVLGARHEPGPRRVFTARGLRELVPDVRLRDVYLCGPAGLIAQARKVLRRLRVPARQIHLDPFEL